MLHFFHGTDTGKARDRAQSLIGVLRKKQPDAPLAHIDAETFEVTSLPEWIGGQGLFSARQIIYLDHALPDAAARQAFADALPDIAASQNAFVVLEDQLETPSVKRFEKYAHKSEKFDAKKVVTPAWNIFALADALGERDKKRLWVLFREAKERGLVDEEIHGALFWMVKSMRVAKDAENAAAAGQKPFVFQKSKRFARNFSSKELAGQSRSLVRMYHAAHEGKGEFEVMLERYILGL